MPDDFPPLDPSLTGDDHDDDEIPVPPPEYYSGAHDERLADEGLPD